MSSPKLALGRLSQCDAYYAVTTVVAGRRPLFRGHALAQIVMFELESGSPNMLAESAAWVVMPDHVHWLFRLRRGSLSQALQRFKSRTARAMNAAVGGSGPVWQAGYYDRRVRDAEDLRLQARYIVANPLRSGLVQQIEDYPFWSCRWIRSSADL